MVYTPSASSPICGSTDSSVTVPLPSSGIFVLSPESAYCFTNCSDPRPKKTAKTASASPLIWAMNGEKSFVFSGVQIFWIDLPAVLLERALEARRRISQPKA